MAWKAGDEKHDDKPLAPGLYFVATPIGNLEDITLRALRVLRNADRIACEDTRQTQKLLNHFQIATPTVSYHQHNESARTAELIAQLHSGARIAVVSDAGTPGISDPGAEIAAAAIAAGIPVIPIPGANAALAALIASGLLAARSGAATDGASAAGSKHADSAAFTFHGFLPAKEGQRRTALESLMTNRVPHISQRCGNESPEIPNDAVIPSEAAQLRSRGIPAFASEESGLLIHIFYEAPHRILATLADIEAVFGPAQHLVLARELTKLHEEFLRGPVASLRATLAARPAIRGEFVLLLRIGRPISLRDVGDSATSDSGLAGCPTSRRDVGAAATANSGIPQLSIAAEVRTLMQSENLSEMDALKRVARARGLSKSAAYREWQRTKSAK